MTAFGTTSWEVVDPGSDARWNDLAAGEFYSTSDWLHLCDLEYGPGTVGIVHRAPGGTELAVPLVPTRELPDWSRYNWSPLFEELAVPDPGRAGWLVGPREGFQTRVLSGGRAPSPAEVRGLVDALHAFVEDRDGGDRCVAMFLDTPTVRLLREAGVDSPPVLLGLDPWIAVPGNSWEDWLETHPTRNRRRLIRRDFEKFTRAGLRVEQAPLAHYADRLGALAAGTLRKYGHTASVESETRSMWRHVEAMGDQAQVTVGLTERDEVIGFCLHYVRGDTIFVRWAGFDYSLLRDASEYFVITYYAQVLLCAERGTSWLSPGIGLERTKALRGAQLRPVWLVDLSADSQLAKHDSEVRARNARLIEEYSSDQVVADALKMTDVERDWYG